MAVIEREGHGQTVARPVSRQNGGAGGTVRAMNRRRFALHGSGNMLDQGSTQERALRRLEGKSVSSFPVPRDRTAQGVAAIKGSGSGQVHVLRGPVRSVSRRRGVFPHVAFNSAVGAVELPACAGGPGGDPPPDRIEKHRASASEAHLNLPAPADMQFRNVVLRLGGSDRRSCLPEKAAGYPTRGSSVGRFHVTPAAVAAALATEISKLETVRSGGNDRVPGTRATSHIQMVVGRNARDLPIVRPHLGEGMRCIYDCQNWQ